MKNMKKKIVSIIMIMLIALAAPLGAFASQGMGSFILTAQYTEGQFGDVKAEDWFSSNVATACRLGLLTGTSEDRFSPDGYVTLAQAVTIAARLHSIYNTGSADFAASDPWYQTYVDYAKENGILAQDYLDYNRNATRAEFAVLLAAALPEDELSQINAVSGGDIPDVPVGRSYSDAVYLLYRAGILTGSGDTGAFKPDSNLKRSEMAAMVTRMADRSLRKEFSILKTAAASASSGLTAAEISKQCADAVVYIEVYDKNMNTLGSGSGFFIDPSGILVTNYHVISEASNASVTLTDGTKYDVTGVCSYDEDKDIAILKVGGSGFKTLEMADSSAIENGDVCYAIGSPYGLENTISQGIVSNAARNLEGFTYIQTSAPISPGSSGGALLNDSGEVIGITCGLINLTNAQNLNLAIPINHVKTMSMEVPDNTSSVSGSAQGSGSGKSSGAPAGTVYYSGTAVPDFGSFAGVAAADSGKASDGSPYYYYSYYDAVNRSNSVMDDYAALLEQCGYMYSGSHEYQRLPQYVFTNSAGTKVTLGFTRQYSFFGSTIYVVIVIQ